VVERLKAAIEKARIARENSGPPAASRREPASAAPSAAAWSRLPQITPDADWLARNRIVTRECENPIYSVFDQLRARLISVSRARGWTRIAITSPTMGCGKSTVSLNLALSMARLTDFPVALFDCDLRAPRIARLLEADPAPRDALPFFAGQGALEAHFVRVDDRLAVVSSTQGAKRGAEILRAAAAGKAIDGAVATLAPAISLFDLPPLLSGDEALAMFGRVDAIVLVAAAGETRSREVEACEKLLEDAPAFLGVVLNKAEQVFVDSYYTT